MSLLRLGTVYALRPSIHFRNNPTGKKILNGISQFSCSVMSDSLQPHGMQHTRLSCPLPTPRACSNYVHRISDAIQPSHPLLSPSPPAFSLSQHQGLFQRVSSHQVPKYWSFSFSISLSNEYSGLISFRIDYSAIKRNRLLVHATAQMNLQGMRLSEKLQS